MKYTKFIFLILFSSFYLINFLQSQNVDVKGQAVKYNKFEKSNIPLTNVTIELYKLDTQNNKWISISKTSTDDNGDFYFNNVPVGEYYLQVNKKRNFKINVVSIDKSLYDYLEVPVIYY
jgi:5-hydroxyisourate hydrolase-like protein (transthyretin family)